jgi:SagB-type dehydrogenase family enzyme
LNLEPIPSAQALAYHERTKHRLDGYAAGPDTIDWDAQPNPFREFAGAPRIMLPLGARQLDTPFTALHQPHGVAPQPLSLQSVGLLLELSFAIAAWKEYAPDRWALRCNPSSGNLHPTEAYVVCSGVDGLEAGVYHYVSRDHALERRCGVAAEGEHLLVGLSSIHWREAWKYGERAFRYCQLDLGHALGALRYAAAALGWDATLLDTASAATVAQLLGLDRAQDFAKAESEEADFLVALTPRAGALPQPLGDWSGTANLLDRHPMYRWPVIDEVAAATHKPDTPPAAWQRPDFPPLAPQGDARAADIILQRRSAQAFDAAAVMPAADFYRMLDCLLPRQVAPWDAWEFEPRVHPVIFVHRVEGLEPGIYILVRDPAAQEPLRAALRDEFAWTKPDSAPAHLPLFMLVSTSCAKAAKTISCRQAIAADGCFSLGMLAEFSEVVKPAPWRYRQLHWEAGLLGHVLYLEAEAAGFRGTGIGCFFDDAFHEVLGVADTRFQTIYHFTVGLPLIDDRITTLPPYPERANQQESPR